MRNKIFGGIGIVWGGLILFFWLTAPSRGGSSANQAGHSAGAVFGGLMLVVGLYYFFKRPKQA
jgi:hypothetical protein